MATSTTRFDRLSTALATHLTRRSAISATAAGVAGTALLPRMGGAQTASPAASPAAACVPLSKEEMEAIAVRFFTEGLAQGNLAVIDEIYDPNGRHNAAFFPAAQDLESIKGVLSGLRTAFPDIQVSVDDVLSDGEFVVVRWTDTGTFTNEILGFAPTGSLVSWTGMNIFQFACGRIVESWAQSDTLTQLGLSDDSATSTAATSSPEASPAAACTETSEAENAEIAASWSDVWSTHDASAYADLADPDVIHHFGVLRDAHGVAALQAGTEQFFTAFPDLVSTTEQIVVDGNLVAVRFSNTGTQTGEFLDVAPTGKTIAWNGIIILRIECGRVKESWSEVSNIDIWRQLGKLDALATPAA